MSSLQVDPLTNECWSQSVCVDYIHTTGNLFFIYLFFEDGHQRPGSGCHGDILPAGSRDRYLGLTEVQEGGEENPGH